MPHLVEFIRTDAEPQGLVLSDGEMLALAQLLKRIGWSDVRGCAVDDDEARVMLRATERVRRALAEVGYAPR